MGSPPARQVAVWIYRKVGKNAQGERLANVATSGSVQLRWYHLIRLEPEACAPSGGPISISGTGAIPELPEPRDLPHVRRLKGIKGAPAFKEFAGGALRVSWRPIWRQPGTRKGPGYRPATCPPQVGHLPLTVSGCASVISGLGAELAVLKVCIGCGQGDDLLSQVGVDLYQLTPSPEPSEMRWVYARAHCKS